MIWQIFPERLIPKINRVNFSDLALKNLNVCLSKIVWHLNFNPVVPDRRQIDHFDHFTLIFRLNSQEIKAENCFQYSTYDIQYILLQVADA